MRAGALQASTLYVLHTLEPAEDIYDDSCIGIGEQVIEGSNIHFEELVVKSKSYSTFPWNRGPRPLPAFFLPASKIFTASRFPMIIIMII